MSIGATAKRIIGRTAGLALKPLGYELLKKSHTSLGAMSSVEALAGHLQELFAQLRIDTVIDVGANLGQYYEFLRDRIGFTGRIVSFEPHPDLAAQLKKRARADRQWQVHDCAAGSHEAVLPLKIMKRTGWSSLLDKKAVAETEVAETVELDRVVDVPVRPLDAVLVDAGRLYIKVDAQGTDLDVLKGAPRLVAQCLALQTELEFMSVYEGSSSYIETLRYLNERKFSLTGAFPIWTDEAMRIGEADAVFRNMNHA
jgi:FkbM family methyltransferase